MNFSETVVDHDVLTGMHCKLNEYMEICMYLRSRSFFDLGPRSLRFRPHQYFQTFRQKPLGQPKSNFILLGIWGAKENSNDPGHKTKMAAIPIYNKSL